MVAKILLGDENLVNKCCDFTKKKIKWSTLNKCGIGAQHGTSRSGVQVSHGSHLALALVLGLFLKRQRLCTGKHLTDGYGQGLAGRRA